MPLGNRDRASNRLGSSRMEDMLAKVLQQMESTNSGDKEWIDMRSK